MNLRGSEWLILLLIVLLLFGARRLPDMARGLGRSLRIFKAETKGLMNDEAKATEASGNAGAPAPTPESVPRDTPENPDR
jgi:sec-independent protein translocase protein TatA